MPTPCEQISAQIGELFHCSPVNKYVRIRTPFLYPDGDVIDLYWEEEKGQITLTDLGETLGWLSMQTASQRKTAKQKQLIQDVCLNHGVEMFRGTLMLRVKPGDNIGESISRLAQASLRIADLWFTFEVVVY